jgi:hypothetical protein
VIVLVVANPIAAASVTTKQNTAMHHRILNPIEAFFAKVIVVLRINYTCASIKDIIDLNKSKFFSLSSYTAIKAIHAIRISLKTFLVC